MGAGRVRLAAGVPAADVRDDADVREHLDLADDLSADALEVRPVARLRLLDDLERAQRERVERAAHALAVHRRRDDEDRRRRVGHDLLGGLQAVQLGHVDVHGDEVGPQPRDHLDGLLAVRRLADDLDLGIGREDLREHLARDERVVGDEHANMLLEGDHVSRFALADEPLDGVEQRVLVEHGLGDVGVGAGLDALGLLLVALERGDDDDRDALAAPRRP